MVSVSKSGCATQSATKLVSVTGCSSQLAVTNKPSFDTFDYQPITSNLNAWPEYDNTVHRGVAIGEKVTLRNSQIEIQVWKNFGGAVAHVSVPYGPNKINQNDWGRGLATTIYRGGRTRQIESQNKDIQTAWAQAWGTTASGGGVGNNPIQIGDTYDNPAVVVQMGYTANMIYTKSVMMNWAVRNDPTDVILEQWVWLDGPAARVKVKMTHNRVMDQTAYEARSNEYPNFIVNAAYKYNAHVGPSGNIEYLTGWNQTPVPNGENWCAMVTDASPAAQGVGLWRPGFYSTSQFRYAPSDHDGEDPNSPYAFLANPAVYSVANQSIIWDWNGTYYNEYAVLVGSAQTIRSWANAQADPRNTLAWKFNSKNGRGWFHYGKAVDTGYPTPDTGIEVTPISGGTFVDIHWPRVAIAASSVSSLYIRYKASSTWPTSNVLKAGRIGQAANEYDGQQAAVNLVCDNTWRTVQIPVSSISGWSGKIQNVQLTTLSVPAGAKLAIQWINTVNADPEP